MLKRIARIGVCVVVVAGLCLAQNPKGAKGLYPTSHGVVKSISGSQLFVEVDQDHEMKFRITRKTRIFSQSKKDGSKEIKASSLEPGQTVDIDMQSSLDGSFEAVRITVLL